MASSYHGNGVEGVLARMDAASAVSGPVDTAVRCMLPARYFEALTLLARSYNLPVADVASMLLLGVLVDVGDALPIPELSDVRTARASVADRSHAKRSGRSYGDELHASFNGGAYPDEQDAPYCSPERQALVKRSR